MSHSPSEPRQKVLFTSRKNESRMKKVERKTGVDTSLIFTVFINYINLFYPP